jgi:predicted RNase H-like nuclease
MEGEDISHGIVTHLSEIVDMAPDGSQIFVDIPVGLRGSDGSGRLCDMAARQLLGSPRRSSIFNAPIRAILNQTDYATANAESKRISGKGLSRQSFAITPKINEVDDLLCSSQKARSMVREVHPELCFYGLAGRRPMSHRKKGRAGFQERLPVLKKHCHAVEGVVSEALSTYPRKLVAADDVLDAFVCAITAATPELWRTVPETPETDSQGLPMEMVYCDLGID